MTRIEDLKDYGYIIDGHIINAHGEQWVRISRIEEFLFPYVAPIAFKNKLR